MKLSVALLSANFIAITAKKPCTASLPDLGKGLWSSCSTDLSTPFFDHGDTCRITGDGCNGQVKCWKGNWIGKTSRFCPKDCEGAPNQPAFGGKLVCEKNGVCVLNSEEGFQCSSSVKCDTRKGRWTGKSKCVFEAYSSAEGRKNPPLRPDGSWKCDRKCKFTCDDGSSGGRGVITKKGWVYDSDWEVCIGKTIVSTVTAPETTKATTKAETSATDPATTQPTTKPTTQPTGGPTTEAITESCTGTPVQPAFGGKFECEDGNCVLNIEEGFKCSNTVKCSGGKWTGKAKCSFADFSSFEAKSNPPSRPDGKWKCFIYQTFVGKCKFTCNDRSNGGTGRVSKKGWIYDLDFDICTIRANKTPDSCSCPTTVNQNKCYVGHNIVVTDCHSCENLTMDKRWQWKHNDEEKTCQRHFWFCQCPNGTPVIGHGYGGQVCQKDGHLRCESCDAGFRLKDHKYKDLYFCTEIEQFS